MQGTLRVAFWVGDGEAQAGTLVGALEGALEGAL
jgi:hypothetical protein